MSSSYLRFTSQIQAPSEVIFDLVADMPNYGRWLPDSAAFGGTVNVTPYPVQLGTTYLDAGPVEKPGRVTEFNRPNSIGFQYTVQIRQRVLTTDIEAGVRYAFEPQRNGTFVIRELHLVADLRGPWRLAMPFVLAGFRKENLRTLAQLKRYAEGRQTA
jgi:hypothetical protein